MVLENKIDSFIGKISLGVAFFETAAQLLVTMIDEEPDVCERIVAMNRADWLTRDVLSTFEAIGRKQLAVEAMFLPKHVISHLITFPVEEQARISTSTVPLLREASARRTDGVTFKRVADLTRKETARVFGPVGLRTIDEQRVVKESLTPEPEKLVGFFELTTMNGKVFLKKVERVARAQKVRLDTNGQCVLELVQ